MDKAPDAFRTISEVAHELDVPQHVLRFWETRFSQIRPMKRGGGRRYYRVNDVNLLKGIRTLLYGKGYTIKGVQRILRERGVSHVTAIGRGEEQPDSSSSETVAAPVTENSPDTKTTGTGTVKSAGGPKTSGLEATQREELKLALADLAAAKRLLTGGKKN